MIGAFAFTSRPFSASTRTTRPARSDLISLKSFIASMRPIGCPTATILPTATSGSSLEAVTADLVHYLSGMFIWGHPRAQINVVPLRRFPA